MEKAVLLKIISILMIIGGAVSALFSILALSVGMTGHIGAYQSPQQVIWLSLASLAIGAIQLLAGIFGVRYAARPKKAKICLGFGIVLLAISLANEIYSVVISGISTGNISSLIMGIILPGLYLLGAFQLRGMNHEEKKA